MEQTTSNNPVIWHSAECQEPTESLLFDGPFLFVFSIHLERRRPWIGLAPKKLTLYTFILLLPFAGTTLHIIKKDFLYTGKQDHLLISGCDVFAP